MQKPYDVMAKGLLEGAPLGPCEVRVEEQVVADARAIDTVVVPDPRRVHELASRGLLGRVASQVCVIEAFHDPPDADEVDDCLLKCIALHARQRSTWRALAASGRGSMPSRARLWLVCAGDPAAVRATWAMVPMPGWPSGCYWAGGERAPHLIVVRALPRRPDTLLLRLLGADETLRAAHADLRALPDDAWERSMLTPVLTLLRRDLPRMGVGEYDLEEEAMRYQEAVELWQQEKAEMRAEGVREGVREGMREAALSLLQHQCERKLGRPLTAPERDVFGARLTSLGVDRVGDLIFDLDAPALDRWLHDPLAG